MPRRSIAIRRPSRPSAQRNRGITALPLMLATALLLGCIADPGPAGRAPPYSGPPPGGPAVNTPPAENPVAANCRMKSANAPAPADGCEGWFHASRAA